MAKPLRTAVVLASLALACTGSISGEDEGERRPDRDRPSTAAAPVAPTAEGRPPAGGPACASRAAVPSRRRLWRLDDAQYGATIATLFRGRSKNANEDLSPPAGLALPLGISPGGDVKFSTSAADRRIAADDAEDIARAALDV